MAAGVDVRHAWAVELLDPRPDERLVDVGCGHGVTVSLVAARLRAGGLVVGVDRSAKVIAMARRRNAAHVAGGRADFVVGAFESIVLDGDAWDTVYAFHVADFWRRPEPMLDRTRALLRSSGRLVLLNEIAQWERRWTPESFGANLASVVVAAGWEAGPAVTGGPEAPGCVAVAARPG